MEITIIKEQRKTMRLSVKYPNILCQVPRQVEAKTIHKFLDENAMWIENQDKIYRIYYPDFKHDSFVLWLGRWLPIVLKQGKLNIMVRQDALLLTLNENISNDQLMAHFYQNQQDKLKEMIEAMIISFGKIEKLDYNKISVKKLHASWGRCHSGGSLSFSNRLVHYPKEMIECVVAHEYAHLKIMNHSKDFYRFLEKLYPDYQRIVKKFKNYLLEVYNDEIFNPSNR